MICLAVLIQYRRVMDRQTDRQKYCESIVHATRDKIENVSADVVGTRMLSYGQDQSSVGDRRNIHFDLFSTH